MIEPFSLCLSLKINFPFMIVIPSDASRNKFKYIYVTYRLEFFIAGGKQTLLQNFCPSQYMCGISRLKTVPTLALANDL
jgi:hypothetical protein